MSLNTSKTELIIFKSRSKTITKYFDFRIIGQKIQPTSQVKYLGVTLQDDLHWLTYLTNLKKNLSHSIGLHSKIRHYVPTHILRTLYYSLFNSYLIYACENWGPNQTSHLFKRLLLLQEKTIRLTKLLDENFHIEVELQRSIFKCNKYPVNIIDECIKKLFDKLYVRKQIVPTVPKKELLVVLPYLGTFSLNLRKRLYKSVSKSSPQSNIKVISVQRSI